MDHNLEQQVDLVIDFGLGAITEDEYVNKRKKYGHQTKWKEMKDIFTKEDYWKYFFLKLHCYNRLKVLIEIQDLTRKEVKEMGSTFNGGGVDSYFSKPKVNKRGITNTLMELAIIMDIPIEMLIYDGEKNRYLSPHDNSFMEYKNIAESKGIQDLYSLLIKPEKRIIKGFHIRDGLNILSSSNEDGIFVRLDRKLNYYCMQFHFKKPVTLLDSTVYRYVQEYLPTGIHVFGGRAFFRDSNVLTFIGAYEETLMFGKDIYEFMEEYRRLHYIEREYSIRL